VHALQAYVGVEICHFFFCALEELNVKLYVSAACFWGNSSWYALNWRLDGPLGST